MLKVVHRISNGRNGHVGRVSLAELPWARLCHGSGKELSYHYFDLARNRKDSFGLKKLTHTLVHVKSLFWRQDVSIPDVVYVPNKTVSFALIEGD